MILRTLIATVILTLAGPLFAHEVANGPNGGRVVESGQMHVELVVGDNRVDVYLTDSADKAMPATGFKGTAILMLAGKSQRIALEPAGDNRLSGAATAAAEATPKGAVRLTGPDGRTSQATFN